MEQTHQQSLLESIRLLRTSQEYSDLKIFCQGKVFRVHKAIVCPRSKVFATACTWGKGDTPKQEIDLTDEDTILVSLMLDYLYQLDYDDLLPSQVVTEAADELPRDEAPLAETSTGTGPVPITSASFDEYVEEAVPADIALAEPALELEPEQAEPVEAPVFVDQWSFDIPTSKVDQKKKKTSKPKRMKQALDLPTTRLVVNTRMYALADKYDIADLKTLAKNKFATAVIQDWKSQAFVRAAELAFETTPSSDLDLRAVVIKTINKHRRLLDYEEIHKLLDSGNGIAWALLQAVLKLSLDQD